MRIWHDRRGSGHLIWNPTPSHALGENYTKSPWHNANGSGEAVIWETITSAQVASSGSKMKIMI